MFPKALLIFFAFAISVSARVISWTGYSEESQEAATEAARAGVAKQISVHIDASTSVTHSEVTSDNGNSEVEKKIKTQNFSRSDLLLNGTRIQVLPKDGKRFGATATLDLDELLSKYRFKLETLQRTINETEAKAKQALVELRFVETDRLLSTIPGIVKSQEPILEEMSLYTPLDNSMRLKTESAAIQQALTLAIRQLQISVSKEGNPQELGPKSNLLLTVTVAGPKGPIPNFPLLIENGGTALANAATDAQGAATFQIPASKLTRGSGEVLIQPAISANQRNLAGLMAIKVPYQVSSPVCPLNLACNQEPSACAAVVDQISKHFGQVVQDRNAKPVAIRINSTPERTLKNITSYKVSLSLSSGTRECKWSGAGAGRTKDEAQTNALKKMDLGNCIETLEACQ